MRRWCLPPWVHTLGGSADRVGGSVGRSVRLSWRYLGCGLLIEPGEAENGVEDGVIEVPLQGMRAKELHFEPRRAEEGAENPGDLGSDEEVSCEPGEEGLCSRKAGGGKVAEEAEQLAMGEDAGGQWPGCASEG